jgi:hypothetical protein
VSPYLGAIIASNEKKKFLRLAEAYGQNLICYESRNLGGLEDSGDSGDLGDLGDAGNFVNLALGGPIAPSNFGLGLGYAEHELAPSVKQTTLL